MSTSVSGLVWRCPVSLAYYESMWRKGYGMAQPLFRLCMTPERSAVAWTLLGRPGMRLSLVILCVLAVSVSACDENNLVGPSVGIEEQFTLAPSDVATVRDTDVAVQFVNVSGDSRCPADAICIQGGDALVNIRAVDRGGSASSYQLHTVIRAARR
jgi:hypothetical protein